MHGLTTLARVNAEWNPPAREPAKPRDPEVLVTWLDGADPDRGQGLVPIVTVDGRALTVRSIDFPGIGRAWSVFTDLPEGTPVRLIQTSPYVRKAQAIRTVCGVDGGVHWFKDAALIRVDE